MYRSYGTLYKTLDLHCYGKLHSAQLRPFETNRASVNKCVCKREILFVPFFRADCAASLSEEERNVDSETDRALTQKPTHAPEHNPLLSPPCVSRCISLHACCLRCTVCGKSEEGLVTTRYKCLQLEIIQQWGSWLVTWMRRGRKKMHHENLLAFKLTFKCTVSGDIWWHFRVSASTTMHTETQCNLHFNCNS